MAAFRSHVTSAALRLVSRRAGREARLSLLSYPARRLPTFELRLIPELLAAWRRFSFFLFWRSRSCHAHCFSPAAPVLLEPLLRGLQQIIQRPVLGISCRAQ